MKTADNGATFQAVFEKEAVAAIGAVAVAPSDAKVVWVGTGEANDRNSSSWGNGVYLSTDSGGHLDQRRPEGEQDDRARSWSIPAIPGRHGWRRRATCGGPAASAGSTRRPTAAPTWKAVLTAPAPYGGPRGRVRGGPRSRRSRHALRDALCAPAHARGPSPRARRPPTARTWAGSSRAADGGATWRKLGKGCPGPRGASASTSRARTRSVVYAIVQSHEGGTNDIDGVRSRKGGVFRSEDGGESWTRTSPLNPRPFYFSQIRVDPENDQRVYVLGFALHVSEDGGRTLPRGPLREGPPRHPRPRRRPAQSPAASCWARTAASTRASTAGETWDHLSRMAAGEYYRIAVDDSVPYRICGGLQDNQTWVGPSRTRTKDGIVNSRLDRPRRRRRVLLRLRPRGPERHLRGVAGGVRPAHRPAAAARSRTCVPSPRRGRWPSASTGTRRSSPAATPRASCTWRATACSSSRARARSGRSSAPT